MKAKLSEIFKVLYECSAVDRYSQTHLIKPESVLEHSGFVALLAYIIIDKLVEEGHDVDTGKALMKAVVHDLDEIITGDMPRPTKYSSPEFRRMVEEIETRNMKIISNRILSPQMFTDWKTAKDGKEGCIVAFCDCLAVTYKVWYEVVMFGNKTIMEHSEFMEQGIINKYNDTKKYFFPSSSLLSIKEEAIILCNEIKKTGARNED